MPEPFSLSDLEIANVIAKEVMGQYGPISLKGENRVNAYEKTIVRNFMNIEYGPGASLEQLTLAYGYFATVADKITASGYDLPKDLQTVVEACKRDLDIKVKDNRLKELRALELQRDNYLTRSEKLGNIEKEIARLKELVK